MPSILFPNVHDLPDAAYKQLAEAYEIACDELVYEFTSVELSLALDAIADALLSAFRSGMRDNRLLDGYAAFAAQRFGQPLGTEPIELPQIAAGSQDRKAEMSQRARALKIRRT